MKKLVKRLRLGKETLANLDARRLRQVDGGVITDICTGTGCTAGGCGPTGICGTNPTASKTPSCVPSGCTQEN